MNIIREYINPLRKALFFGVSWRFWGDANWISMNEMREYLDVPGS